MTGRLTTTMTVACCLMSLGVASGETVLRRIAWPEVAGVSALPAGAEVRQENGGGSLLRVVRTAADPASLLLLTIDRPGINEASYAVRGRVRYQGVAPGSYLEMWNHLPDGAFFSRTLGQGGPMGRLDGSSDWRPFVLPFFNKEGGAPPERLVVNLVLAGAGTVEIGPLELVQFGAAEDPLGAAGDWWSARTAALVGSAGGGTLGLLGALIGWLASSGRARGFVLGSLRVIATLGIGALLVGMWAVADGQPYAVYYPLLLTGVIAGALGLVLPRELAKRYRDLELRRIQALDA